MNPQSAVGVIPYSPDTVHVALGLVLADPQVNANAVDLLIINDAYVNVALVPPAVVWPGESPVTDMAAWETFRAEAGRLNIVDSNGVVLDVAGRIYPLTDDPDKIPPGVVAKLDYSVGYAMIEDFAEVHGPTSTETFNLTLGAGTYKIVPIYSATNNQMTAKVTQGEKEFEGFGPYELEAGEITVSFTALGPGQGGGVLCLVAQPTS